MRSSLFVAILFSTLSVSAHADIFVPSDGSDGVLTGTQQIDLSLAAYTDGEGETWEIPSPIEGQGVYDTKKWAVVFKYESVNIASGQTITFKNHPSRAPVVWLVQGDVTIAGTVNLDGGGGNDQSPSSPGPGGFRGGRRIVNYQDPASEGLGPGGGGFDGTYGRPGSYATNAGGVSGLTYGNVRILPLIGGSGGAGDPNWWDSRGGGGAGGGAILIAAQGEINIASSGLILCRGGNSGVCGNGNERPGAGSGGAIRLVADLISGSAPGLRAIGGCVGYNSQGGNGRIRLEANAITITNLPDIGNDWTWMLPPEFNGAEIWPAADAPTVRVTSIGGEDVPIDPSSRFAEQGDVFLTTADSVDVVVEAENVPLDWTVVVEITQRSGDRAQRTPTTLIGGNELLSTWSVRVPPLPATDYVAVQARAYNANP
ncbi:MAG: hypothetical protein KDA27_21665 [Candidatus Eisenbacteria bacterium]|uniref:Uncharacterized protein n=1 Tax=Eiseniibacteriota bacterium TaxID=2212470 RepID=A0A956SGB8_UNCEI|nr:hypothetical protein [Candidatus Eisenbacteria bacterium]